jgi:lysozyme
VRTSPAGLVLIKQFEGFRADAYLCPAGVPTIGYGFTEGVKLGDTITRPKADARLARELGKYEAAVLSATGGNCTQCQFDALVSFAFNVGIAGMRGSSVIKAHCRGDFDAAARAFALWNRAGGRVLTGLTRRRAAEAALYLTPDAGAEPLPMPQAVEPESKLTGSPTVTASTVAATTTIAAGISRDVKDVRDALGDWLPWVLVAVAVGAAGYVVLTRVRQRAGGWA